MSVWNWPQPGLIGLWHLEDNCIDSSGEGNNGSPSTSGYWGLGKFGRCVRLQATIYSLPYAALQVSDLTISMWYRGTYDGGRDTLFAVSGLHIGYSGYEDYGFNFETRSGIVYFTMNNDYMYGTSNILDGNWHRITATRDDSYARIYVDGRIEKTRASPPDLSYCVNAPASYYYASAQLGASWVHQTAPSVLGNTCGDAWLDEIMLYDYAFQPDDELEMYNFQAGIC